ncbi:MAG: hypothetical protein ACOY5R_18510 [Pseudomonadota bacterium]
MKSSDGVGCKVARTLEQNQPQDGSGGAMVAQRDGHFRVILRAFGEADAKVMPHGQ